MNKPISEVEKFKLFVESSPDLLGIGWATFKEHPVKQRDGSVVIKPANCTPEVYIEYMAAYSNCTPEEYAAELNRINDCIKLNKGRPLKFNDSRKIKDWSDY